MYMKRVRFKEYYDGKQPEIGGIMGYIEDIKSELRKHVDPDKAPFCLNILMLFPGLRYDQFIGLKSSTKKSR